MSSSTAWTICKCVVSLIVLKKAVSALFSCFKSDEPSSDSTSVSRSASSRDGTSQSIYNVSDYYDYRNNYNDANYGNNYSPSVDLQRPNVNAATLAPNRTINNVNAAILPRNRTIDNVNAATLAPNRTINNVNAAKLAPRRPVSRPKSNLGNNLRKSRPITLPDVKPPEGLFKLLDGLKTNGLTSEDETYYWQLERMYVHSKLQMENYGDYFETLTYMEYYEELKAVEPFNEARKTLLVNGDRENSILMNVALPRVSYDTLEVALHSKILFILNGVKIYGIVSEIMNKNLVVDLMGRKDLKNELLNWCDSYESTSPVLVVKFLGSTYSASVKLYSIDEIISDPSYFQMLFPTKPTGHLIKNRNIKFYNKMIEGNKEQADAVINIVNGTSKPAPYIIFGPPGTGKTTVLVEAILQLAVPKNRILVCAPSNTVCNYIAVKCAEFNPDVAVRFIAKSYEDTPEHIYSTCKIHETAKEIVTISTLVNSVHADELQRGRGVYTHVFIDEAGYAVECEAIIAILKLQQGGQLVLSGDPKQLAPVCLSTTAEEFGLNCSLLERLYETNPMYQKTNGAFDSRYISMLRDNYRCHEQILSLSSRLFYDNMLRAKCPVDPLSWYCLKTGALTGGGSLVFHAVMHREQRSPDSCSYYNEGEMQQVLEYIELFLCESFPFAVLEEEIGVVTPYKIQASRIETKLSERGWSNILVGTADAFQGQERRVIIVSTVRSQGKNKKPQLGFVSNERRFNVMLTRAAAKCIVIGNPFALRSDENCWEMMIQEAISQSRYIKILHTETNNTSQQPSNRNKNGLQQQQQPRRGRRKRNRSRKRHQTQLQQQVHSSVRNRSRKGQ